MANKNGREIVYLRGKLFWAKLLGDPVLNYGKDGKEWTTDLSLDDDGVAQMKKLGLAHRIKDKDDDRGKFTSFRQRELKADGTPAFPPKVMDAAGNKWDPDKKLGNGTLADVKFEVVDYGKGKPQGVYIRAVRVLNLVTFESQEFAPLDPEDEYFKKAQEGEASHRVPDEEFAKDFGLRTADDDLDDDITIG